MGGRDGHEASMEGRDGHEASMEGRVYPEVAGCRVCIPMRIRAYLSAPCVPAGPLLLDGLLYFGVGRTLGRLAGGWTGYDEPFRVPLPLGQVQTEYGWWWAASQATPVGGEAVAHTHRRTSLALLADRTDGQSVNRASGPDKSLRAPVYYRWRWRVAEWTAVGNPEQVAALLAHVPGLGARTTQGWGRVEHWEVAVDDSAPGVEDYGRLLALRHLPVGLAPVKTMCGGQRLRYLRRMMTLQPPYWDGRKKVPCWQAIQRSECRRGRRG